MSQRTSEANKAIEEAWEKEFNNVLEGKGTRDWTSEQQNDILEKGRAYDENGKAFEGHHMKSVEAYPEHQGNSENIQFLSREEHKAAHNGNYQNPTNGSYDPGTGETKNFGKSIEQCKAENLSNPINMGKGLKSSTQQAEMAHERLAIEESLEEEVKQEM